ncbi:MAG: hypothetical protein MUE60_13130 [Candidatus Eisenbacteria bacterium]|nr:hypothetical protein [Candidatus Eisenbacteria bacterium]
MKRSCISLMALSAVVAGVLLPFETPTARASFVFSAPVQMANINTVSCDTSPSITANGLELYFASAHPYGGDLCQSQIWVVTRPTVKDPWGTPKKLDLPVNAGVVTAGPCISADGLELYFYSGRNFLFAGDCRDQLGGYGQTDLWVSKRTTREAPWGVPQNLGPAVNGAYSEMDPSISSDGLSLHFASYRDMNSSGIVFDLYVTTRPTKNDPWGNAVRLPAPIPFTGNQFTPFLSPDGLSLYFSQSSNSRAYDVYVSRRASLTAPWETPVPFTPVNSPLSEYAFTFAPGSSTIYFARSNNWPGVSWPCRQELRLGRRRSLIFLKSFD